MEIQNLESYNIDEIKESDIKGKLICGIHYDLTYPQIIPKLYITEEQTYSIKSNPIIKYWAKFIELREQKFEVLTERFQKDELFLVTEFTDNENFRYDNLDAQYFLFGNCTKTIESEILEIYNGAYNLQDDYFEPAEEEILELLKDKIEKGSINFFYIRQGNKIYGPFKPKSISDKIIKISSVPRNHGEIYEWNINNFANDHIVTFQMISSKNNFLTRSIATKWLDKNKADSTIKFVESEELITWIKRKIEFNNHFTKSEFKKFKDIYNSFKNISKGASEKYLYERSLKLLDERVLNINEIQSFLEKLPETKEFINSLDVLKNQLNELNNKKTDLEFETNRLEKDVEIIKQKKANEEYELKRVREEEIKKAQQTNVELKQFLAENKLLESEVEKISKFKELKNLESEIDVLNQETNTLTNNKNELNEAINTLTTEFISTHKESQEKLRDLIKSKAHFDFLKGKEVYETKEESVIKLSEKVPSLFEGDTGSYVSYEKLLLGRVKESLKSIGRNYKSDFIANVLISMFQNTVTVFAGLPGTGKTSLARILSELFTSTPDKRVEIAVAKGWTSQKDFIGFYNPLSKQFVPNNKKMYNLLNISNQELSDNIHLQSNLGFVILDEANLSPIEHYWSSFYNLTDSVASEELPLTLNIGQENLIIYPNNIRFLATINMDHTTEELSPRIIDRANIIRIPIMDDDQDFNFNHSTNSVSHINFTFEDAIKIFNLPDYSENYQSTIEESVQDFDVYQSYLQIKKQLRNMNIILSPRVDNAFNKYMIVARKFMNEFKAFDYFVSQRILTKIDGQGEAFKTGLDEFYSEMESIFVTAGIESYSLELLKMIIETGSQDEYYLTFRYLLIN